MGKRNNNLILRPILIACLGIALLFAQTFKLHAHLQHDESPTSGSFEHTIGVHIVTTQHDTLPSHHHQNDTDDYHSTEIDIDSTGVVKKSELLNPFTILFLIVSIILCAPYLIRFRKNLSSRTIRPPNYYLIQPPLRAPPV